MMLVQKRKNIALILKRSINEPSVTAKTDDVNNINNNVNGSYT